jgi:hypothetical protein
MQQNTNLKERSKNSGILVEGQKEIFPSKLQGEEKALQQESIAQRGGRRVPPGVHTCI